MAQPLSPVARLWNLVQEEKSEITAIYFFAILGGFIQLTLPVGIQAIIGFVLGGTLSASITVLITILSLAVFFTGIIQINQMKVIEKIQQRIFVRYSFAFADRIPKLDLKQVDGFYLPELVNRFFDTMSLQKGFAKLLLDLPLAIIQIVFGLILLSFYHPFFIIGKTQSFCPNSNRQGWFKKIIPSFLDWLICKLTDFFNSRHDIVHAIQIHNDLFNSSNDGNNDYFCSYELADINLLI